MKLRYNLIFWCIIIAIVTSCNKVLDIKPPVSSITTAETFTDSTDANSAILGIYSQIEDGSEGSINFASGAIHIYSGESADELVPYYTPGDQFYSNELIATNNNIFNVIWQPAYSYIYQANACIEGLEASKTLSAGTKNQLLGEAKFIRAFCYFYLVNLFGEVPYITSAANFAQNNLASKLPSNTIYQAMITDLQFAQANLRSDFSISGGERTRANKWAATALLARIYLFEKEWANAEAQASQVINNSTEFSLDANLNNVFLANSSESILQWEVNAQYVSSANLYATNVGYYILPRNSRSAPNEYLSPEQLSSFEPGDQRFTAWVDSSTHSGVKYYYPYKYKIGSSDANSPTTPAEYDMVLRLAEQYLIRAEARAELSESGAVSDINVIRSRAGLANYSGGTDMGSLLTEIAHQWQDEYFCEWGFRWLNLKRTGQIDVVMGVVTPKKAGGASWQSYQELYPIPQSDMLSDPNLKQNPGY